MRAWLKRWWPVLKVVLAVAIVVLVGYRFANDLARLDWTTLTVRPAWLVGSALLYLFGMGFSAWYWYWLLWCFGEKPGLLAAFRAHYVSQLGKYVPGKALALVIRGTLIQAPDVKFGVAIIAAFYEVLTTMAAGALVAALLFTFWPPQLSDLPFLGGVELNPVFLGLLLLGLAGFPLLPGVFNRLVQGLARRFQNVQSFQLPRLGTGTLILGVIVTAFGWVLVGLSLWAAVQAILPEPQALDVERVARYTAMMSLAYVAGFLFLVAPSGVGVREFILDKFLPQEIADGSLAAEPLAALGILLLRLLWTATELLLAGILYFWKSKER